MIGKIRRWVLRAIGWFLLLLVLVFGLQYSTVPLGEEWAGVSILSSQYHFDYVAWEIDALWVKTQQTLFGVHPYITEGDRSQLVREYMADLSQAQRLESQISNVFATSATPEAEAVDLIAERDALRTSLRERQAVIESILEGQVAVVLVDLGFAVGGQLMPPVAMHFTEVPNLLVVSPRDEIDLATSVNVVPMPVNEVAALEERVESTYDVAALTVPLGGMALYPSMNLETASISYALEVIAHEWLHHYLIFFPLGYSYGGEARIINETTASQFGKEVGQMVLERYYPELVVPPAPPPDPDAPPPPTPQPPAFDFNTEMHITRVHVDELLAEGKIDEAEAYMEERRQIFVANGYVLRRLNQAFFAFYGGYQSGSPGVGGSDPIGPAVREIRQQRGSVYAWIETLRGIITRDELLAVRDSLIDS
jgi:hypothetical protein